MLWHNVSTWSDTLPHPSVSPGRHTYQQCCICRGSQGSANCVLKTAISYESIIHREGICLCTTSWVILPFLIFPSFKIGQNQQALCCTGNKALVYSYPSSTLWICRPDGCIFRCRTRCWEWSCGRLTLQVIASPSLCCKLPEAINCTVCTLHRTFLSFEGMRKRPIGKIKQI